MTAHVRPFLVAWFIAFFGLGSVVFFPLSPTGMRRGGVLLDLVAVSISLTFGLAAVVTSVGLLAGYVPFVPSAAEGSKLYRCGLPRMRPRSGRCS